MLDSDINLHIILISVIILLAAFQFWKNKLDFKKLFLSKPLSKSITIFLTSILIIYVGGFNLFYLSDACFHFIWIYHIIGGFYLIKSNFQSSFNHIPSLFLTLIWIIFSFLGLILSVILTEDWHWH